MNGHVHIPRPSYFLFSKSAAKEKKMRPFYRAVDKHGLMYAVPGPSVNYPSLNIAEHLHCACGLDRPTWRPFIERDWRFGHYKMDGLQDPISRLSRFILSPLLHKKDNDQKFEEKTFVMQLLEISL